MKEEKTSIEGIPEQTTTIKSNPNYIYIREKWRNSPFYIFCQANIPFISQDFDGLNYYNLLCQLVDFLNKVIHDSELVIDKTDELVDLYNKLQTYVTDYFSNLDVQEEINNKLDSMADSGELYTIIKKYTDPIIEEQDKKISDLTNKLNSTYNQTPIPVDNISKMVDTSRSYLLTTDGKWYYYNGTNWVAGGLYQAAGIADNSIYEYQLNNSVLSRKNSEQPFTYDSISHGLIKEDGSIASEATWVSYIKFSCSKGQKITVQYNMAQTEYFIAFYDENNTFLLGYKPSRGSNISIETVNVPDDTSYALVQGYNVTQESINNHFIMINNVEVAVDEENTTFETTIDFIKSAQEMISNSTLQSNNTGNSYISYSDGNSNSLEGNQISTDYVEIKPNTNIRIISDLYFQLSALDGRGLAFYDENKLYISGIQYTYTKIINTKVPENAKYIRLTVPIFDNNIANINIYYMNLDTMIESIVDKYIDIDDKPADVPLATPVVGGGLTNIFDKIFCIGDSLTRGALEGADVPPEKWDNELLYSYPKQLQRTLGNTVYNEGRSGSTAKSWYNELGTRLDISEYYSNAYIIALGTNDIATEGSFTGSISDINVDNPNLNADTSVGWYGRIIQKIKANLPYAKIFCVGIPYTRNTPEQITEANQKIKDISSLLGCYFLDMQKYGIQQDQVEEFKAKYYKGGHLNCMGYKWWSDQIASYIDWIINHNPNDFWNTPFITIDVLQ